jgi:endonuclease YncB( thermonuclease family)
MKNNILFISLIFSAKLSFSCGGFVLKITDGDTFWVEASNKKLKIRLFGIDSPEKLQPFGSKSTEILKTALPKGSKIYCEKIAQDIYGRTIAKVWNQDSLYINKYLLQQGAAWWYRKYAANEYEYRENEQIAMEKKIGLWSLVKPIAPWEYRKRRRKNND